jgi:hypothetical protein
MQYYLLALADAQRATYAVWAEQTERGAAALTKFRMVSVSGRAELWTPDREGEALLREVLRLGGIRFQANATRRIDSEYDSLFE